MFFKYFIFLTAFVFLNSLCHAQSLPDNIKENQAMKQLNIEQFIVTKLVTDGTISHHLEKLSILCNTMANTMNRLLPLHHLIAKRTCITTMEL